MTDAQLTANRYAHPLLQGKVALVTGAGSGIGRAADRHLPVTNPQILVEVCVDSLASALIAQQAGANRIELNLALQLDGLTPSAGLLRRVVSRLEIPVIAMARPRDGGFCYSADDWETLLTDADWLVRNGASGIAFGALSSDGSVDVQRCRQLRELVGEKELGFHKAFDKVTDPLQALEQLVTA